MDPNTTLTAVVTAISNHDLSDALTYLDYYRDWRKRGGFEPQVMYAGDVVAGDALEVILLTVIDDMTQGR